MASAWQWVLAGVVAYTLAAMALHSSGRLPDSIRVSGPIVTIHTGRGRAFLNWLASPRRFWRGWGNLGLGIALVVMVGTFLAVVQSAVTAVQQPERTAVQNPQNVLVIPGVNDFLPLAAAPEIIFGLLVGLVVHEGGHGLLCRVEGIDIESMGVAMFAFIPVGAFVEPSEESRERASRGSQTRMFAAGVTNNFFVSLVCFALLFGPIVGSIAVAPGVAVGDSVTGSAAAEAGIGNGDRITSVGGTPVGNASDLERALSRATDPQVTVGLGDGSAVTVERRVLITRAVPELLAGIELRRNQPTVVEAVDGTAVATEDGLAREFRASPVVELSTNRGTATVPIGAYVAGVDETGPLAAAGAPTDGTPMIVTHIDGRRTANFTDLSAVLDGIDPGTTVPVVAYVDGSREVYDVTLAPDPDGQGGFLGVRVERGYSGIVVDDFGVDPYPAEQFLGLLGGDEGGFVRGIVAVLLLPFFSTVVPGVSYNFAGFLPDVTGFFTVTGPLAGLGGGVFLLANVLFWTGWINLNLGLFNCIPTFPLDGGHIFRASAESVVARLPVEGRRRLTTAVTASVSLVMIVALVLMLFGPQLFG